MCVCVCVCVGVYWYLCARVCAYVPVGVFVTDSRLAELQQQSLSHFQAGKLNLACHRFRVVCSKGLGRTQVHIRRRIYELLCRPTLLFIYTGVLHACE